MANRLYSEYHKENDNSPKNEFGVTAIEECVINAYFFNDGCRGRKELSLVYGGYSMMLTEYTQSNILSTIAKTVFSRSSVKKRMADIQKERDGEVLYDKVSLQEKAQALYEKALEEGNLSVAKSSLEMMMKNLGMLTGDQKKDNTSRSASKQAREAFAKRKANIREFKPKTGTDR